MMGEESLVKKRSCFVRGDSEKIVPAHKTKKNALDSEVNFLVSKRG